MESGLLVRSAKVYALHLLPIPARVILRKVYVNDHFVGWQLLFEGPERSVLMVYVVNVCGKPRFQFDFQLPVKISQCCCPVLFDCHLHSLCRRFSVAQGALAGNRYFFIFCRPLHVSDFFCFSFVGLVAAAMSSRLSSHWSHSPYIQLFRSVSQTSCAHCSMGRADAMTPSRCSVSAISCTLLCRLQRRVSLSESLGGTTQNGRLDIV